MSGDMEVQGENRATEDEEEEAAAKVDHDAGEDISKS